MDMDVKVEPFDGSFKVGLHIVYASDGSCRNKVILVDTCWY